jgi:hypothetical protein
VTRGRTPREEQQQNNGNGLDASAERKKALCCGLVWLKREKSGWRLRKEGPGLKPLRSHPKSNCNCRGNGKGEIQGSLHYAADDKTVRCFGRHDVCVGKGGEDRSNDNSNSIGNGKDNYRILRFAQNDRKQEAKSRSLRDDKQKSNSDDHGDDNDNGRAL